MAPPAASGAKIDLEGARQPGQIHRIIDDDAQLAVLIERGRREILRPDEGALAIGDDHFGMDVETFASRTSTPAAASARRLGREIRCWRDHDAHRDPALAAAASAPSISGSRSTSA